MKVQLDMYQTLAIAVLVLLLGSYLRKKIKFLERFCIPAPVVGGLLFAIFTCICYVTHILEFSFDDTLKEVCMVFFFTSVGFQANLKVLKKGGKSMVIFLGLVIVLIFIQNGVAVGLSKIMGLDSLIGMCTGSIPMVGGHGTAGAFGPVLEDFNVKGATTICTAAATFGLIFGSLVGGPLGKRLIEKKNLLDTAIPEDDSLLIEDEKKHERHSRMYASAVFQLIIAIGIGTIFSWALTKTGLTFPIYIGAMIAAALMRNIAEYAGNGKLVIHMGEINDLGGISLSLFLGMAMITLKLWQLASLALPLVILLGAQIMVIVLFTYFIVFNIKELMNSADNIRNALFFNILKYAWGLCLDTGINTCFYVDEAHVLLSANNALGAEFLAQVQRRARKYNTGSIIITQQPSDFAAPNLIMHGKAIFDNASYYLVMGLKKQAVDDLGMLIDLNDNEKESIKRYSQGEALFVCGNRRMRINVVVTPEELESFGSGGGL